MNNCEIAINLIEQIPEAKLLYVIPYLQGVALPDDIPNSDTLAAMAELESGKGSRFSGSTEDLFAELSF